MSIWVLQFGDVLPRAIRPEVVAFLALAFVGGLVVIYSGFRTYRFGQTIRNTSPEPAGAVAMGRTEVQGEAVPCERVIDQPFTDGTCVYAEYKVREYKEADDDDESDSWITVEEGSVGAPFYVEDETGRVYVDTTAEPIYELSDARFERVSVDGDETPPPAVRAYLGAQSTAVAANRGDDHLSRSDIGTASNTGRDRRYLQRVLPVGAETYVYGGATPHEATPADAEATVGVDPGTEEFIVSDLAEFELARGYTKRSLMYMTAGLVAGAMILALLVYVLTGPGYGPEAAMP